MESVYEGERIVKVNIENQMKSAYIDYSMSVIVARALPDVRDGLNLFIVVYCLVCTSWEYFQTEHIKSRQE